MTALRKSHLMTVAEFQEWEPEEKADHRWHLIDGVPVCMSPASSDLARIVSQLIFLLQMHVNATMPGCDVLAAAGVIPTVRSMFNERVPDVALTCEPASKSRAITTPVVLFEVLSPSNSAETQNNAAAYCTIASVREVVLLGSQTITAEVMTRMADGTLPPSPKIVQADEDLVLSSIGFRVALRNLYRTTSFASG